MLQTFLHLSRPDPTRPHTITPHSPHTFQELDQLRSLPGTASTRVPSWPLQTARFGPAAATTLSAQLPATPVGSSRQPLGSAAPSLAWAARRKGLNRDRPAQAPPDGVSVPRVGGVVGKREGARRGEGAKEAPASNLRAIEKEPARTSPKLVGTPGRAGSRSGAQRRQLPGDASIDRTVSTFPSLGCKGVRQATGARPLQSRRRRDLGYQSSPETPQDVADAPGNRVHAAPCRRQATPPRAARPLAFPSGDKLFCKPLDQTCCASPSPSPSQVRVERSSSARCLSAKKAKARGRARRRTGDPTGSRRLAKATRAQVSASLSAAPRGHLAPFPCVPAKLSWRSTGSPSCHASTTSTWCPSAARTRRLLAVPPGPSRSAVLRAPGLCSRAPASVAEPRPGVRL